MNMQEIIKSKAKEYLQETIEIRRKIHQNPELSFEEYETSKFIKSYLESLNIESKYFTETGVVAHLGKGEKCIALRADIDALPIEEETELEFCSTNQGIMHACGHDLHTSMLLTAARILKELEDKLSGTVKLIFQPGEEKLPGGAKLMIENGVLNDPKPEAIFGQHVNPELETGVIAVTDGPVMASADELYWTLKGKGCHAAQPHKGADPILAASQLIVFYQSLMTKYKDPLKSGVLTVTSINGGSATNIIPDNVKLIGTMRAFDDDWRLEFHELLQTKSRSLCALYGVECNLEIKKGYPPLINNKHTSDFVRDTAIGNFGVTKFIEFIPKMWAEDFAYYAQEIPSTFWFLGVKAKDQSVMPALHNSKFNPQEEAMLNGIIQMVSVAVNYFKK